MQMLETVACGIGLARSGLRRGACARMLPLCTTSTPVVTLSPGSKRELQSIANVTAQWLE